MKNETPWIVSIKVRNTDTYIWMDAFPSEEKADQFIKQAKEKIKCYGLLNKADVCKTFTPSAIPAEPTTDKEDDA